MNTNNKKTLIFGLDGASWKIINPLLEKGELPNLKMLIDNGTYGSLLSTQTMISPSVWTSIMTGKTPQNHGILNFMTMQNKLKAKRIWDIFEDYGKTVGIAGFLMTWPPKLNNNGFMIPDHFAPDSTTIPEDVSFLRDITSDRGLKGSLTISSLWRYLFKLLKYHVDIFTFFKAFSVFLEKKIKNSDYLDMFHKEINLFMLFMEKIFTTLVCSYQPDLSAVYFPGTDVLAHKYWCYFRPEDFDHIDPIGIEKYGSVVPDIYISTDRAIGRILKKLYKQFDDLDVVVVSDHGFRSCHEAKYHPNAKIEFLLNEIGMGNKFRYTIIGHNTMVNSVDSDMDVAEKQLRQLKQKVENITVAGKNVPIFEAEMIENYLKISAQPLWKGYKLDDTINLEGHALKVEDVLEKGALVTGRHEREGIFIISGKDIKKGNFINGAEVYDITPTILALNNLPVAEDMDGKVLRDAIEDEFWKTSPLKYIDTYGVPEGILFSENELEKIKENEDALKSKLKSLGYID